MKANLLILKILEIIFIFQSCNNKDDEPYIIIKDSYTKIITQDTIEIEANLFRSY